MTGSTTIEPFWQRLRAISLYPTHLGALSTIAVLALCHLVRYLPFGGLLDLLVWVALYKYAFECLRASANGQLEPPELAVGVEDDLGWKQIWLQVLFIVFGVLGLVLLGPVGGVLLLLLLGVAFPGAVMSLAMEESLLRALNPGRWLAIFARLGWPYLAVAALCLVIFFSQAYAQAFAAAFLPDLLALLVTGFIAHYAIVATFHLMGYLIYQYHAEIGYEPVRAPAPLRRASDDPDQGLLDEAAQRVRDGQPDAARELIATHLRTRGGSEAVHAQYRKLLALGGQRDEQLRHGREWISALLAQDKDRRAVDVARECLELDPAFEPAQPDQVARLAQKAADAGLSQVALRLLSGFHQRHPKHRDIPRNYLLAAKVLAERMGKDAEARALLDQLTRAYPEHPLAGDIAAYRQFLDKLAVPASKLEHS
jgi:hypothetical protein